MPGIAKRPRRDEGTAGRLMAAMQHSQFRTSHPDTQHRRGIAENPVTGLPIGLQGRGIDG